MTPDHVDANTFRTAAGRLLGWQTVKSTMFEVRHSSNGYVLTGRGSGHGVGLCVRGAINRGRQGATRDEILSAYFPGLSVTSRVPGPSGEDPGRPGASAPGSPAFADAPVRVGFGEAMPKAMTSLIRVHLPEADRRFLAEVRDLATRLLAAVATKLGVPTPAEVDLRFHPTVEAYTRATGQPWWTAARTIATRIDLLPRGVLQQRSILESTLQHEFVHVIADPVLFGRPLWVREGLAVVLAGEFTSQTTEQGKSGGRAGSACPPDAELRSPQSADTWRRAYQAAGRCVSRALSTGSRWQDLR
jgi:hypothetical protein